MRRTMMALCMLLSTAYAQELYIFTEPASNMPARSIGPKYTGRFQKGFHSEQLEQRHTAEIMVGASKNLMLHGAVTFSDMYSNDMEWESVRTYAKYRFLSSDNMYRHFRMAAFAELGYAKFDRYYDEIALEGDNSGIQGGLIATQLLHKLAISSTLSYARTFDDRDKPYNIALNVPYEAINYSLSAGYLVFPKDYVDYKQTNFNVYVEMLGQRSLDKKKYLLDLAPGIQFIFNSQAKLNLGYRMQLNSNMHRMAKNSGLVSFEWLFLNALK